MHRLNLQDLFGSCILLLYSMTYRLLNLLTVLLTIFHPMAYVFPVQVFWNRPSLQASQGSIRSLILFLLALLPIVQDSHMPCLSILYRSILQTIDRVIPWLHTLLHIDILLVFRQIHRVCRLRFRWWIFQLLHFLHLQPFYLQIRLYFLSLYLWHVLIYRFHLLPLLGFHLPDWLRCIVRWNLLQDILSIPWGLPGWLVEYYPAVFVSHILRLVHCCFLSPLMLCNLPVRVQVLRILLPLHSQGLRMMQGK